VSAHFFHCMQYLTFHARQLKNPAIRTGEKSLWMQLASLQEQLRPNLDKKMSELVEEGEELTVTDKSFPTQFKYKAVFSK
jgi:ubiquitin-activating enzyme E1 C